MLSGALLHRRVLVAMIVYNGRAFVPRAIASVARLDAASACDVDVLVLDDASPDPGWSGELELLCASLGVGYYRSPRNLGIPRNMNLGLLRAEAADYDLVVILNSDVVVPANFADGLLAVAQSDPTIASVTAWSNNASIFSLPHEGGVDTAISDVSTVDAVSASLASEFGTAAVDVPVGMGFCMAVPRAAIADIGLFDPVFGRGYCEEVDWCLRATERGRRNVLAPSVFVYHMGSASTRLAGILGPGEQTVQVNEEIVDQRHPTYRADVAAWERAGGLRPVVERGLRRLLVDAVAAHGYVIDATWLRRTPGDPDDRRVLITVNPDGPAPLIEASFGGWRCPIPIGDSSSGMLGAIAAVVGCAPAEVRIHDRGALADRLADAATASGVAVHAAVRYPERV